MKIPIQREVLAILGEKAQQFWDQNCKARVGIEFLIVFFKMLDTLYAKCWAKH